MNLIPLYSADGRLFDRITENRAIQLESRGLVEISRKRSGHIGRATMRPQVTRSTGRDTASDYSGGTRYVFLQHLESGHRAYELKKLGDSEDDSIRDAEYAPRETRAVFLQVIKGCMAVYA